MTTLYRLAKLICLGIIAYSLWRISQKDFVANVTVESKRDDPLGLKDWDARKKRFDQEIRLEK